MAGAALPRGWTAHTVAGGFAQALLTIQGLDGIAHVLTGIDAILYASTTSPVSDFAIVAESASAGELLHGFVATTTTDASTVVVAEWTWSGEILVPPGNWLKVYFNGTNDAYHGQYLHIQGYDV